MNDATPKTKYLKDYRPPAYLIDSLHLKVVLGEDHTVVTNTMQVHRNEDPAAADGALVLAGTHQELTRVALNDTVLKECSYAVDDEHLTINEDLPAAFTLEVSSVIRPQDNKSMEGLYKSSGNFCTQCEPEGFRRITYFLDQPDVMARFTTTIEGDKQAYPVLLSNGNLIDSGDLPEGRHYAVWEDPFKKPSYLFALVAGDLVHIEDTYKTMSGRDITLRIYVQKQNIDKCEHAMLSLKHAMKWDEDTYGREYDLDLFMIFSADDFNMGAMENKGLNIFNSALVLARPDTATDMDYDRIEGVIGHEYFHNWSGNRVTCRDWFQLSLKEGFTVFRDQSFSAAMSSKAVKRIEDVNMLRMRQFPEDAGPLSHPVRPASYVEINNFYTMTVYEKSAEVVRMIHTLMGPKGFRAGSDLYFERHDGQAVTVDDFAKAMEDANNVDLTLFKRWYSQAGTPVVTVIDSFDDATGTYELTFEQRTAPTPGQPEKLPLQIPMAIGLLDNDGKDLPLQLEGEDAAGDTNRILVLTEERQSFRFVNLPHKPLPSLLRNFSAPVKLQYEYNDDQLAFLLAHDSDDFNRWEAGQKLAIRTILRLLEDRAAGKELIFNEKLADALREVLANKELDKRLIANAMALPDEIYLAEQVEVVDPEAIFEVRQFLRKGIAARLKDDLLACYKANVADGPYEITQEAIASRTLKNLCLAYLAATGEKEMIELAYQQFVAADNMTDSSAALSILANTDCPQRQKALDAFYEKWQEEPLVLDKWFQMQSASRLPDTLQRVKELMDHPRFDINNPNKMRAVIGSFCMRNPVRFNDPDGGGYAFLGDMVATLNSSNPLMAARMLTAFSSWKRLDAGRQELIKAQLQRILALPELSKDVFEIASKTLGA